MVGSGVLITLEAAHFDFVVSVCCAISVFRRACLRAIYSNTCQHTKSNCQYFIIVSRCTCTSRISILTWKNRTINNWVGLFVANPITMPTTYHYFSRTVLSIIPHGSTYVLTYIFPLAMLVYGVDFKSDAYRCAATSWLRVKSVQQGNANVAFWHVFCCDFVWQLHRSAVQDGVI